MSNYVKVTKKIGKDMNLQDTSISKIPVVSLIPINDTFEEKQLDLLDIIKIGRKISSKHGAETKNGIFDSKVLSRAHAELYFKDGKVFRSEEFD